MLKHKLVYFSYDYCFIAVLTIIEKYFILVLRLNNIFFYIFTARFQYYTDTLLGNTETYIYKIKVRSK